MTLSRAFAARLQPLPQGGATLLPWIQLGIVALVALLGFLIILNLNRQRRSTDQQRRENLRRYLSLFENMAQGVVYQNRQGEIVAANPAAERILGMSFSEMAQRTSEDPRWKSIREDGSEYPGDEHPAMIALRTGKPLFNQVMGVYNPREGRHRWLEISAVPEFQNNEPIPYQTFETFTDVTERVEAEQQRTAAERRFRALYNDMAEGVALHEVVCENGNVVNYRLLDVNKRYEEIIGISREKAIGRLGTEVYGTEEPPYLEAFTGVCSSGFHNNLETYFPPLDKHFYISVSPISQNQFATIFFDITNQKKAEAALRQSEERYRLMMENMQDVVWQVTPDLKFTYISPSCSAVMGYQPAEVLGKTLQDFLTPQSAANLQKTLTWRRQIQERGETLDPYVYELQQVKKDGRIVWTEITSNPVYGEDGNLRGFQGIMRDISSRKEAEEALEAERRVLQTLLENLQAGVFMVEAPSGKPIVANQRAVELLGRGLVNAQADTLAEVYEAYLEGSDQPYPAEKMPIVRGMFGERSYVDDMEVHRPDGTRTLLEVFGSPVIDGSGKVNASLVSFQDITRRKQAEAALKHSEERLRLALEAATDGMWDWNITTGDSYFSPRWFSMLGYEPNEFKGTFDTFTSLLHPDDVDEVKRGLQVIQEDLEGKYYVEFRMLGRDGKWRWILSRGKVVERDANGAPLRMVGTHSDITDRKRLEEALQQRILALTEPIGDTSDLRFNDLFNLDEIQRIQDALADTLHVSSLILSPSGETITRVSNPNRLCGTIRDTPQGMAGCLGSPLTQLHTESGKPLVHHCVVEQMMTAGASIHVGGRQVATWIIGPVINKASGQDEILQSCLRLGLEREVALQEIRRTPCMSRQEFDQAAVVLQEIASQFSHLAAQNIQQAREIARRMQAEKKLRDLNLELENRVRMRTAQMETVINELEAFSYSVSHDLRAPLRSMDGFSQALLEDYGGSLQPDAVDYLRRIRKASQHMGTLIDDLLNLSRVTRSQMDIKPVDLSMIARGIIKDMHNANPQRQVEFVAPECIPAAGDAALLNIALTNLLNNAWKFTSHHPSARIELGEEQRNGTRVFFVRDDGAGFEMQFANKLFGAFQRLHTSSDFEGTGIGLAIVQRIIRRHNGEIWAEGAVENGATFYFSLG